MVKKTDPKVTELTEQLAAEHDARLRLAAEFANFQRRAEQENAAAGGRAVAELLTKLFPIFDNFSRAAEHAPELSPTAAAPISADEAKKIANYISGIKLIESQMETVLTAAGLERIPTIGMSFDPSLHDAVSMEESAEVPADAIIAEIESGWLLNGQVIRPAKVRVSKG